MRFTWKNLGWKCKNILHVHILVLVFTKNWEFDQYFYSFSYFQYFFFVLMYLKFLIPNFISIHSLKRLETLTESWKLLSFFSCWHEWVLDIFWHSFVVSTTTSMSKFSDKKKVVWLCSITSWDQFQSCLNLGVEDVEHYLENANFKHDVWVRFSYDKARVVFIAEDSIENHSN